MTSTALGDGFGIAVLLPCHNVERTIGGIVRGFAAALPGARVYVFDNNSIDDTAREAAHAGARVFRERRQGKGAVVRRMFADVEADIYVMAAGDGSDDPNDAPSLVNALITEHVDMVVGRRPDAGPDRNGGAHGGDEPRAGRRRRLARGADLTAASSGYRAFTRRFVKSFPATSDRLAIETEMSVHASQLMIPVAAIEVGGGPVPERHPAPRQRSPFVTQLEQAALLQETRPLAFFGLLGAVLALAGALLLLPSLLSWPGAATASGLAGIVLATGLMVAAVLLAVCGLILDSVNRSRIEQKRILFLAVPALGAQ